MLYKSGRDIIYLGQAILWLLLLQMRRQLQGHRTYLRPGGAFLMGVASLQELHFTTCCSSGCIRIGTWLQLNTHDNQQPITLVRLVSSTWRWILHIFNISNIIHRGDINVCYLVRGGPSDFWFFCRKNVGSRKLFVPKGQKKFLGGKFTL